MDDEPEGYREPARRRRDDDLDSEQAVEDAPAIQLANLLLIGACTPEGTLLRAGTWPDATVERREVGGAWTLALDPLVGGAATIARRFRLMTGLPVSKEPLIGFIHLRIGEREEDFCAFVRPVPRGERIVLRHLPLAVRRLVLGLPKDDGALAPLRWTIEHAFRLARSERPSDAIAPLTQLLGDLEPYGEDGARMKTRVAWALGSVAEEVGRLELAAQAFADGAAAALDSHGRGPTWVEAVERHAAVARHLHPVAAAPEERRQQDDRVRVVLDHED
ncbi:MAG: hypothetical protein KC619_10480, partial [Myxococcales bacterium]|nr:hypothetical protein [Myxococcales bacterium]